MAAAAPVADFSTVRRFTRLRRTLFLTSFIRLTSIWMDPTPATPGLHSTLSSVRNQIAVNRPEPAKGSQPAGARYLFSGFQTVSIVSMADESDCSMPQPHSVSMRIRQPWLYYKNHSALITVPNVSVQPHLAARNGYLLDELLLAEPVVE